jgi:hypothetical protein
MAAPRWAAIPLTAETGIMATTATHNSSRASDESSSTADFPPAERQGGTALADADETSTSAIQPNSGLGDALKAERRRSNNLEKELRGLRQQLTRFSEINPEEYARLQQAERQMEEASARKVAAVAAERDADSRGTFFRCSRASWARASGSPPTRTASTCWNHWTARASRCWGMTAASKAPAAAGAFGEVLNPQQ